LGNTATAAGNHLQPFFSNGFVARQVVTFNFRVRHDRQELMNRLRQTPPDIRRLLKQRALFVQSAAADPDTARNAGVLIDALAQVH
jgi:hypothetical protein